jgi:multicomponent Na+:H+ antiporter subunit B
VSARARGLVFLAVAAVLAAVLVGGAADLPAFGHYPGPYGLVLNRVAVRERSATDVVTAIVFDYRGVDTMVEEFILYAAALGVALLLRATRDEEERRPPEARDRAAGPSEAVRALGVALVGVTVVHGLVLVTHGQLTPGGGFQGGAVLASAAILVFLVGGYPPFRRRAPEPLIELAESAGTGAYPVVGALGLISGGAFLANVLPLRRPGDLLSAGTLPVLNLVVGVAVAGGFVLILSEFLEQALAIRERRP